MNFVNLTSQTRLLFFIIKYSISLFTSVSTDIGFPQHKLSAGAKTENITEHARALTRAMPFGASGEESVYTST